MKDNTFVTIQSWMRTDLNLSGNELLVYAIIRGFSQDGETKFSGSRQYLADWCGCSVRSIQTILNDLVERKLLTKYESTNNGVKFCSYVANFTTSEKISPPSEKISLNNIDNTIEENDINIINNINTGESEYESHMISPKERNCSSSFLGSCKKERKTKSGNSLYSKCSAEIYKFTQSAELSSLLSSYLSLRLSMKDKPLYGVNQWVGLLNKLASIVADNNGMSYEEVVKQSIERGYASFFPVSKQIKRRDVFSEYGETSCEKKEEELIGSF